MSEEIKTKICRKCGAEKKPEDFSKDSKSKDGLRVWYKECDREYGRSRADRIIKSNKPKKVYANPELASFTPRQLIEELKARGYTGELKYVQVIKM